MYPKISYAIKFLLLVFSSATNASVPQLEFTLTPNLITKEIKNEVFESASIKSFQDSDKNIIKGLEKKDCDHQCAEKLFNSYRYELLMVDQEVRDPYYGAIDTGFTNCVENKEIEKLNLKKISENKITIDLYSNNTFSLSRCMKKGITFKVSLTLLFCEKTRKFWTIKYYQKLNSKRKISYSC